jgi:hypothetical protein
MQPWIIIAGLGVAAWYFYTPKSKLHTLPLVDLPTPGTTTRTIIDTGSGTRPTPPTVVTE